MAAMAHIRRCQDGLPFAAKVRFETRVTQVQLELLMNQFKLPGSTRDLTATAEDRTRSGL